MELAWGFGQDTGVDLPAESTGTIPTRQWLYYLWKHNAYTGHDWCKYKNPNGSYVSRSSTTTATTVATGNQVTP